MGSSLVALHTLEIIALYIVQVSLFVESFLYGISGDSHINVCDLFSTVLFVSAGLGGRLKLGCPVEKIYERECSSMNF